MAVIGETDPTASPDGPDDHSWGLRQLLQDGDHQQDPRLKLHEARELMRSRES